jgi:hypothetical protein
VKVEFECVLCCATATARVDEADLRAAERPVETLRDCPDCGLETIWLEV